MPNPPVVLCDSDATYQLLLGNQVPILRALRDSYGMQPMVVEEVELEILSKPRLEKKVGKYLRKLIENGTIARFDRAKFESLQGLPKNTSWTDIQAASKRYRLYLDTGEAYTHAAAALMGVPSMSNDFRAIKTAFEKGIPLPTPVFQAFDILCFGFQAGILPEDHCNEFLKTLKVEKEWVPKSFVHDNFVGGLSGFTTRLACTTKDLVAKASSASGFAQLLKVTPLPKQPASA